MGFTVSPFGGLKKHILKEQQKMKTRSMYKAERLSVDRISTLPQPILETILSLLPTEDAARTSILSREWRYKWTNIPNLRFELHARTSELTPDIESEMKYMDMYDVYRVLLLHQGPIHQLTLVLALDGRDDSEDDVWYKLPESVFTLHHLTDLYLSTFDIDHPSVFNGFGGLRNLDLSYVTISTQTLLHVLSNCPSLKTLSLDIWESGDTCTMNELLKCLPVIEDLTMSGDVSEWLIIDLVPQELPTSLIHLKSLCLNQMCLTGSFGSAFLLALIKCSPNVERMHLEMEYDLEFSAIKDKYSDVWLEHLNVLGICFGSTDLETKFVKFILARSPRLKKVSILTVVDRKRESKMLKTLLRAPRASLGARITTWR
ncbi:putative F-box domain, leucine-rich repeat domain superfamily, F-box-like domain superfamily [Helianthus annuus]|nr:putative F-box domain, leucine-rich repeat domain superfamily, F-box-like domain superfamily [Helianthus annuus]